MSASPSIPLPPPPMSKPVPKPPPASTPLLPVSKPQSPASKPLSPLPLRPQPGPHLGNQFAIVASRFNAEFVQSLVDRTSEELYGLDPSASLDLHSVPGAFEIPLGVKMVAAQKRHAAVIALGLIIQGETNQAQILAQCVTEALQRLALSYEIPIINGVLFVKDEEQARERCMGDKKELNRGLEMAKAAIRASHAIATIKRGGGA